MNDAGYLYDEAGMIDSATKCFLHACKLEPTALDFRVNLGICLKKGGKLLESITHFKTGGHNNVVIFVSSDGG